MHRAGRHRKQTAPLNAPCPCRQQFCCSGRRNRAHLALAPKRRGPDRRNGGAAETAALPGHHRLGQRQLATAQWPERSGGPGSREQMHPEGLHANPGCLSPASRPHLHRKVLPARALQHRLAGKPCPAREPLPWQPPPQAIHLLNSSRGCRRAPRPHRRNHHRHRNRRGAPCSRGRAGPAAAPSGWLRPEDWPESPHHRRPFRQRQRPAQRYRNGAKQGERSEA